MQTAQRRNANGAMQMAQCQGWKNVGFLEKVF